MITEKTTEFNIQDFLKTPEEVIEYFKASLEEDTPKELERSISNILVSEGYAKILQLSNNSINNKQITCGNVLNILGFELMPKHCYK